ncbi:MAG: LysR family transcriptional regulator [Eubacterium sp.]|nr:LysR family transcriptional regulator [Eubacterium sp.]
MSSTPSRYEIFLKVAELGNISHAAAEMNYTQSGVSHAIAALEKETGLTLFIRSKSGVVLTESGKLLLEPVRDLVNRKLNLEQTVLNMKHTVAGKLTVATFASVAAAWLPRLTKGFGQLYPNVEISILDGSYTDVSEWIEKGTADCGFISYSAADGLDFISLRHDPLLAVLPRNHDLSTKASVTVSELLRYPFITPADGFDNDAHSLLYDTDPSFRPAYSFGDDTAIMAFIYSGAGVGIMPGLVIMNSKFPLDSKPLDPPQHRDIGLAFSPGRTKTSAAVAFLDYVKAQVL